MQMKYLMWSNRLIVSDLSLIDLLFVINEKQNGQSKFFDALLLKFPEVYLSSR